MEPRPLKVARIGNSRGVRLPAATLARYDIGETVIMEERLEGILLRPRRGETARLSWEDTATAMAGAAEDWSDWDVTIADGLEMAPWPPSQASRVAESAPGYATPTKRGRRVRKK